MKARLYKDMRGILYILQSLKFFRLYLGNWLAVILRILTGER